MVVKTKLLEIPIPGGIFLLIALLANFILRKTQYGRQLNALENVKTAAEKVGIHVKNKLLSVYVICGVLSGLAGCDSGNCDYYGHCERTDDY